MRRSSGVLSIITHKEIKKITEKESSEFKTLLKFVGSIVATAVAFIILGAIIVLLKR